MPRMLVDEYDFELPDSLIAQLPLMERDSSRLLDVSGKQLADRSIVDLPSLVKPGDVWVLNDTRVIPARLIGRKETGGRVELLLIEPDREEGIWLAWGRANKTLHRGEQIEIANEFSAEILSREGKQVRLRLIAPNVPAAIESHGHIPLPPYIRRADTEYDRERYQTVYASNTGSVAAPTAGLHLTESLMQMMEKAGAQFERLTLSIGPGTFQPIQAKHIEEHEMHAETYNVPITAAHRINTARREGRRIIAVGTTALRAMEASVGNDGCVREGIGKTDIFIYPGYKFRVVDALLTNFHLPRSTLLMLVAAMTGRDRILAAYKHAMDQGYRFYSYGDAMFVSSQKAGDYE